MRKIVVHMQTTLDGRISNTAGLFWEPFPFGDPEMSYVNDAFRRADTWAMSRRLYEFVVPFWEQVAAGHTPDGGATIHQPQRDFADILVDLDKVVFSNTIEADPDLRRVVISGDIGAQLAALKQQPGNDIILSAGPDTLGPLLSTPGLVDELLLVIHPAVLTEGPRLFDHLGHDLALDLVHAEVFDAGAVIARYKVEQAR